MKKITLVLFMLIFISQFGLGQGQTFKESKSIEFQEKYEKGDRIVILGERTFITLKSWNKDFVSIKAEVTSRFNDQSIARSDLEKIELNFGKSGKKITYSNAIRISGPKDKPVANLKVFIEVFVPESAIVEIENHFGEINVEAILDKLTIESDFTAISIINSKCKSDVSTQYGDTTINGLDADISLFADRSNLSLQKLNGELDLEVKYGEVELYPTNNTVFNKFKAKYSPVNIFLDRQFSNQLDILCEGCAIQHENIKVAILNDDKSDSHVIINQGAKKLGTIISEIEDILIK